MAKYYNFEIYTCHPETLKGGWDIQILSVKALTLNEALENLKVYPLFDEIISFNYVHHLTSENLFINH